MNQCTTNLFLQEVLKKWNLEFEQELISCEGKQIKPEVIMGGGNCEASYQVDKFFLSISSATIASQHALR